MGAQYRGGAGAQDDAPRGAAHGPTPLAESEATPLAESEATPLAAMAARWARPGRVLWLGARPARLAPMRALDRAAIAFAGLEGDRRETPGKRAVTLIQAEHLPAIAALCGLGAVAPEALRRNVVVAGINLLGLRARRFRLGGAVLEGTGLCAPCSRMEAALGPGGYAAVRGHGGICARVVEPGPVRLGDALTPL